MSSESCQRVQSAGEMPRKCAAAGGNDNAMPPQVELQRLATPTQWDASIAQPPGYRKNAPVISCGVAAVLMLVCAAAFERRHCITCLKLHECLSAFVCDCTTSTWKAALSAGSHPSRLPCSLSLHWQGYISALTTCAALFSRQNLAIQGCSGRVVGTPSRIISKPHRCGTSSACH